MTNLEKWKLCTQHLFSAPQYLEFAWLFIVSTAVERRVWYGKLEGMPLFCNMYALLVGPPAVGKGLTLGLIKDFLTSFHTIKGFEHNPEEATAYARATGEAFLFKPAPEDVTYEAFVEDLSAGTRLFRTKENKVYAYAPAFFCLEELATLFKSGENGSKLHKLLLVLYDCKGTRYKTRHRGDFLIKNPYVTMIAGVQPETLGGLIAQGIIGDGFMSRFLMLYAQEGNRNSFFFPEDHINAEEYKTALREHVLQLSKVYGQIIVPPEIKKRLEDWFHSSYLPRRQYIPSKMEHYYDRKPAHLQKIAAAYHFSESTDLTLSLGAVEQAIEFLDNVDKALISSFTNIGRNDILPIERDVIRYILSKTSTTVADVMDTFHADLKPSEALELLQGLAMRGKIKLVGNVVIGIAPGKVSEREHDQ